MIIEGNFFDSLRMLNEIMMHVFRQSIDVIIFWLCLQGLELAVPGTYMAGTPVVTIAAFAPQLTVITSKQRPRKLTIHGSDGAEYMFLLKVQQLNNCL